MKNTSFENPQLLKLHMDSANSRYKSSSRRKLNFKFSDTFKKLVLFLLILLILGVISVGGINLYVRNSTSKYILPADSVPKTDCVLILGAGVWGDRLSSMLYDRVKTGAFVAEKSGTEKILMSGDHGRKNYDEVNPVLNILESDFNFEREDVFLDHAGFSTYDSMYRADYIFQVKSTVIVTQKYHLYRAIYNARKRGIEAYGVAADRPSSYYGMTMYKLRESIAIAKDFVFSLFNFDPELKGEVIPITGDGTKSHDIIK